MFQGIFTIYTPATCWNICRHYMACNIKRLCLTLIKKTCAGLFSYTENPRALTREFDWYAKWITALVSMKSYQYPSLILSLITVYCHSCLSTICYCSHYCLTKTACMNCCCQLHLMQDSQHIVDHVLIVCLTKHCVNCIWSLMTHIWCQLYTPLQIL